MKTHPIAIPPHRVHNMRTIAAGLALLCILFLSPDVQAQTLKAGTWTGQITPPDGQTLDITYEVSTANDSLKISMIVPERGTFPFEDITLEDGVLSFFWEAGEPLGCNLTLGEDGTFAGECSDIEGTSGQLTMVPPEDGE